MSAIAYIKNMFLYGLLYQQHTGSGLPVIYSGETLILIVVYQHTSGSIFNLTSLSCSIVGRFNGRFSLSKLVKLSKWNGFTAVVLNLIEPCGSYKI